jgi:3-methyladenine DNA glycosylase AlkD
MNPDEILKQLESLADPEYRESSDYFAPQEPTPEGGRWMSVGVRAPALREFEKPLFKQLKTVDDYHMMVEFTDEAFRRRIRELLVIGFEGLFKLKKYWNRDILDYLPKWIPQLSDWGTTDSLGGGLLGEMILEDVITIDDLVEYREFPSVWGKRMLIVATVRPFRKGHGDIERYFEVLSWYADSKEKMIVKAVSWALREATKSRPDKVQAFIDQYEDVLHSLVLREVRNKLKTGLKNPKT